MFVDLHRQNNNKHQWATTGVSLFESDSVWYSNPSDSDDCAYIEQNKGYKLKGEGCSEDEKVLCFIRQ